MAHFAKVENSIVTRVIVAEKSFINTGIVGDEFLWVQTSYNKNFRKNFAGVGYTYDEDLDAFIPPKPYSSWILDEDTCNWESPTPYPGDEDNQYMWDEEVQDWTILEEQENT